MCVPTRDRERAKHLILLPTVDVVNADVHDAATLARLLRGMDAVINLVGVLHDGRGTRSFEQAHVELTRKVIAACASNGVRRYVHMSALGADVKGPSRYQRTKGAAEALVRAADLDWTIFRPSVVFGRNDRFLNLFAQLQKMLPAIFLGCPRARFQPVYVEDVAAALVMSLDDLAAFGQTYDLCGPKVYTLRELVALVGAMTGKHRPIIGLSDALSCLQAFALELLPGKLLSRDNCDSMKVDNVSSQPFPFGIEPEGARSHSAGLARHGVAARRAIALTATTQGVRIVTSSRMAQYTLVIGNKAYSSWSLRPWLAMKHAGLAFDEVRIPLYQDDFLARIRKYSPSGKVPILVDGEHRRSGSRSQFANISPNVIRTSNCGRPMPRRAPTDVRSAPRCTRASRPCAAIWV